MSHTNGHRYLFDSDDLCERQPVRPRTLFCQRSISVHVHTDLLEYRMRSVRVSSSGRQGILREELTL
ncbi:hypothetical protein BRC88_11425 [Halobacteriales archaeon QS_4_69_225]|nr:MAG: hypothetical protein BRC88_11425 [Halobacteriales archaeon QS_4_69_225]